MPEKQEIKVCVIGAGVSGVACAKELAQQNVAVDVYEMMPITGGVFGSYTWKGGQFTSSLHIYMVFGPSFGGQTKISDMEGISGLSG